MERKSASLEEREQINKLAVELAEEVVLDPEVDHHEEAEVPNEADAVDHTELLTPLPLTTYLQDATGLD